MGSREVKRYPTLAYCNTKPKEEKYKKLVLIDLCPTRFVKYNDLEGFGMEYFRQCELADLFNYNNQRPNYPDMVRLFYANIGGGKDMVMTAVKGEFMSLTSGDIGRIFDLRKLSLKDINLNNGGILKLIFTDGEVPKGQIFQNSLTPEAKVISKIIIHNVLPKINSRHYLLIDHVKLLYVIFGGLNFNWAKFFFKQMIKDHTSCIPYGALITRIFEEKKIVLKTELDKT